MLFRSTVPRAALLVVVASALFAACGAGAITGGILGSRGRSTPPAPPARVPEFTVDQPEAPLVNAIGSLQTRTLLLRNVVVPDSQSIRIELRALGVVESQPNPILLSSDPDVVRVGFVEGNTQILSRVADPSAADVTAQLAVFVQGREVAAPVPFTLLRQPRASLVLPPGGGSNAFVSVLGGTPITFRVRALRSTALRDVRIQFATPNPTDPTQLLLQTVDAVSVTEEPSTGAYLVQGLAPQSTAPVRAVVAVVDARAGQSTVVDRVFFQPAITAALPREGVTDGGTLVTLFGQGLVPLNYEAGAPPPLDFTRVTLEIEKGGRRAVVPAGLLRPDLSSLSRLVFTLPPSPDGRAGSADVVLKVRLGSGPDEIAVTEVRSAIAYGHRDPTFGPRGALLPERPSAFVVAPLDGVGAPDIATVSVGAGIPRLQLLRSDQNGMFLRFNRALDAASQANAAQREPRSLAAGDFDRDGVADLLVVNQGSGNRAEHTVVRGQAAPAPPLAFVHDFGLGDTNRAAISRSADLDGDGDIDVVVLPDRSANDVLPKVFLATPPNGGGMGFSTISLTMAAPGPFDAMEIADLDGDDVPDLVFARGGDSPVLVTLYGRGDGTFDLGQSIPIALPGYFHTVPSTVVGVHACGDASAPPRAIALVFAGEPPSLQTPPAVAVAEPEAAKRYGAPSARTLWTLTNATESIVASLGRDLDGDRAPELVVAMSGRSTSPLRLLKRTQDAFAELQDAVEPTVERIESITGLASDELAPATTSGTATDGVFVLHRVDVDGVIENRIATYVVATGPRLLAPDAAMRSDQAVVGLALGDFTGRLPASGEGLALDVCAATASGLQVWRNDGFGDFTPRGPTAIAGLVPETLVAMRLQQTGTQGEAVAFLRTDGQIGLLLPGESSPLLSNLDLRTLAEPGLRGRTPGPRSRLVRGDVDGDGVLDLVALISLAGVEPVEGETLVLLLRGKSTVGGGEFPLHLPNSTAVTTVHGQASAIALGDIVREVGGEESRLEIAVAVPRGDVSRPELGNHVRFYRYVAGATPAEDRLQRSFTQSEVPVLLAGDQPERLLLADMDGNGYLDVVVACAGDGRLRVFLNDGSRVSGQDADVNISAFREALGVAQALPLGMPTALLAGDLTGDGRTSIVTVTTDGGSGRPRDSYVAVYVPDGAGSMRLVEIVPAVRTGNRLYGGPGTVLRDAPIVAVLDDCNGDGRPDLAIGWGSAGAGDRNLRVLFGGVR